MFRFKFIWFVVLVSILFNSIIVAEDLSSKPPKVSSFKVNGNNKAGVNDVSVMFKVKGNATSYHLSGDPEVVADVTSGLLADLAEPVKGVYTVPSFDLSTVETNAKGKKNVYLVLSNDVVTSKINKTAVTMQVPKASALKVNGNNKTSVNDVSVTFKVKGDAVSYYLSGDPKVLTDVTSGLIADLAEPVKSVYTVPSFDLSTVVVNSKGKKNVYLVLTNEVGDSKIIKTAVTLQVPKASALKVNGNNKASSYDVPVTFKATDDAISYYLSGDPEMLTGVTSGFLADLDVSVEGVYTVPLFDLSTATSNAKGKRVVYLQLDNEIGVSKNIAAKVSMSPFVTTWDTSLAKGTTVTLALAGEVDATIYWGDGAVKHVTTPGPHRHNYGVDGVYTVSVTGNVSAYNSYSNAGGYYERRKLISVESWGQLGFTSMKRAFFGCSNLVSVPTTSVGIEAVTDMSEMFRVARLLN